MQTLAAQPFVSRVTLSGTSNAAATLHVPFTTPLFPGTWIPRTPTSQLSETIVAANIDSPMTQQYNLDIQYEAVPKTVLDVAYVGTRSTRLAESRLLNRPLLASPDHPINGQTSNTVTNAFMRAPYTGFAATSMSSIETYGFPATIASRHRSNTSSAVGFNSKLRIPGVKQ